MLRPGLVPFAILAPALLSGAPTLAQDPELVAPGVVSLDDRHETFPAIDPRDGSLWFSVVHGGFDDQTLYRAPAAGAGAAAGAAAGAGAGAAAEHAGWGTPEPVSFSGRWGDRAPRFDAAGDRLYFTSNRPRSGQDTAADMNIWVVERAGEGWSEPAPLPEPVNSDAQDIHAAVTEAAVWVASNREPGLGRSDLYRVPRRGDGLGAAESLPFNDERSQPDVLVDRGEAWAIVVVTDHPDGLGGDDLFLARRTADGWGGLEHLPAPINSGEYEYGPTLSPDGRWLYFTSHRRGTADVFRVPISAVLGTGGGP